MRRPRWLDKALWTGPRLSLVAAMAVLVVALGASLLQAGCTSGQASSTNTTQSTSAGPTKTELAELRTTPTAQPISGPRVPELFSVEDAERLTGLDGIHILACTG